MTRNARFKSLAPRVYATKRDRQNPLALSARGADDDGALQPRSLALRIPNLRYALYTSRPCADWRATRSKCSREFRLRARRYLTICMGNVIDVVGLKRIPLTKVIGASSVAQSRTDNVAERDALATAALITSKRPEHWR